MKITDNPGNGKLPLYELIYETLTLGAYGNYPDRTVKAWTLNGQDPYEWFEDSNAQAFLEAPATSIDRAKNWANRFITEHTDYTIAGWDDIPECGRYFPSLQIGYNNARISTVRDKLKITLTDREYEALLRHFNSPNTYTFELSDGSAASLPMTRDPHSLNGFTGDWVEHKVSINLNCVIGVCADRFVKTVELYA
jgi:hypothetical protein